MAIDVEKPSVDESVVRYQGRTILLQLAGEIANSGKISRVKTKIKKAAKLRRWLKALDYKEFLTYQQRYTIVYKLIEIGGLNDFPTAPVLELRTRPDILIGGGGGGGSGTVTSFSVGNLSPLFTASVADATTTPALSFALSNAAQNSVLAGPATGGAGASSYRSLVAADIPAGFAPPFADNAALIKNNADNTKLAIFSAAEIGTGVTRTFTLPNFSGDVVVAGGSNINTVDGLSILSSSGNNIVLQTGNGRTVISNTAVQLDVNGGTALLAVFGSGIRLDLGSDAAGDFLYRGPSTTLSRLAIGTAGQSIRVDGAATGYEFFTPLPTQLAALSVLGNGTNATADMAAITAGNDHEILRRSGTTLAFGSINLASSSAVGISILAPGNGGTGLATYAAGDLIYASTTSALSRLADVAVGSYLRSGGVNIAPLWSTLVLPNAATAQRVVYATGTNVYGESANLTFSGTQLAVIGTHGITNGSPSVNSITTTLSGTVGANAIAVFGQTSGNFTTRGTSADNLFHFRANNGVTTGATNQVLSAFFNSNSYTVSHTGTTIYGFRHAPALGGAQTPTHIGLAIESGQALIGGSTITAGSVLLDLQGTGTSLLLTRITNTGAVTTPVNGMIAYDSSTAAFVVRVNGNWDTAITAVDTQVLSNKRLTNMIAGSSSAGSAPINLTSGAVMATPENGAVEYDGTNYFVTAGGVRYTIAKTLTATAALDFPSTTAQTSSDLTITVTGAATGDAVILGVPNGAVVANTCYTAWVSAADTVSVRLNNYDALSAANPGSNTFRVSVLKY